MLIQIRVGGQAARLRDETVPLACGCIGQETTGAGGFAKALRTVPVVLEIAARARERAAPGAWIVDFTNPVGIVTRALLDARPPRGRPVQRRDRVPALVRGAARGRARADRRRPGRPQPPDVGARACAWTARTCCRSCSRPTATHSPRRSSCRADCSTSSARSPPTTCATSTRTTRCSRSSATGSRARRRSPRSSTSCSSCTATLRSPRSPRCSSAAAAPSTARRRSASSRHSAPAAGCTS